MAQLLVMKRDNHHPDPAFDRAGCYKTGDVVAVFEDDHVFSAREQAEFSVVDVPGPATGYAYLATEDHHLDLPVAALQNPALMSAMLRNTPLRMLRRRRYRHDSISGAEIKYA